MNKQKSIIVMEYRSVALGMKAADAMLKSANVKLLTAQTVCPGKYIVILAGNVSAVRAAWEKGKSPEYEQVLVDDYLLGNIHDSVFSAIYGTLEVGEIEALGIMETYSVASIIGAADKIVKTTPVRLIEIRIARGMSGKSYAMFSGELAAVEASMEAAVKEIQDSGLLLHTAVIPNPDPQLVPGT